MNVVVDPRAAESETIVKPPPSVTPRPAFLNYAPGLAMTVGVACAAFALRLLPGVSVFSPVILSILIGVALKNVAGAPAAARPGIAFSLRRILRFAIVLLGLQLSIGQVLSIGASGLTLLVGLVLTTLLMTKVLGRVLGVEAPLAELIAVGTSICGAGAIIAANAATQARDEDTAYAVACVTVFGTIAMFAYPLALGVIHLSAHEYGLWAGASIHEVAQVVAAAYQGGKEAGDLGTIAKLARVLMLAPMVLALGAAARMRGGSAAGKVKPPVPWFVFGFLALVVLNSVGWVPVGIKGALVASTPFLLSVAVAAMGLETDIRKLRAEGLRPLALGALASLFISGAALLFVRLAA
jgi:uncharacterized integral membrane protein (TIGR00698 family)